ncbi:PIN domain-containing protein [Pelagicoccus enzymogenes]|uniref:PIN domain-containing protein n=1 Tax=Pelagicoccus enzymogenes TaxID=2773457 RepID=UPI00280D0EFD|nr:PIN domain-containing protein [Pelagicoccus enzymogenes]MDQ8197176.1 PIN domain-containing protein [Pelagicoccus enzymogenes]
MKADFKVTIDACVLANYAVCDLLLRLAERPRQYLPVWSDKILDEVYRTQIKKLNWPKHLAEHFRSAVTGTFPEASISDFEHIIPSLNNHEKDRHVLAAAIHSDSSLILTFNLRDFPKDALEPWKVEVSHPQDYLIVLHEMEPVQMASRIAAIAAQRKMDQLDLLLLLGKSLPNFASRLIDDLGLG